MGLSGVKGSGASLNNILTHSQESANKKNADDKKVDEVSSIILETQGTLYSQE